MMSVCESTLRYLHSSVCTDECINAGGLTADLSRYFYNCNTNELSDSYVGGPMCIRAVCMLGKHEIIMILSLLTQL